MRARKSASASGVIGGVGVVFKASHSAPAPGEDTTTVSLSFALSRPDIEAAYWMLLEWGSTTLSELGNARVAREVLLDHLLGGGTQLIEQGRCAVAGLRPGSAGYRDFERLQAWVATTFGPRPAALALAGAR